MATLRERLTSAAFGAGWDLVCRLPESVARGLFNFGADVAWRRQGGGVRVLEGNLLRVLGTDRARRRPRRPARGWTARSCGRSPAQVMRSYARYYLETFRMQAIPDERIATGMHVNFDQADLTLEYMKNGRGVIYALPHMGDFEQAGRWIVGYGAGSFTTVAERLKPEAVFQRFLDFRAGARHGSAADHGRPAPVRRHGAAAAGGQAGLHRGGPGPVGHRGRGGLLRREGAVPGRPGVPGGADGRRADAGVLLVRRRGRVGRAHLRRDRSPGRRHPQGEGRRDDPGDGRRLRGSDPRAPGRLAHAAEGLRQRPGPRAPGPQPEPLRATATATAIGSHCAHPRTRAPSVAEPPRAAPRRAAPPAQRPSRCHLRTRGGARHEDRHRLPVLVGRARRGPAAHQGPGRGADRHGPRRLGDRAGR